MEEPPSTRPNRWTGPPSTWRSYTKDDRHVAASLDMIRAQDLSTHLYNAYAIKARVRADRKGKGKSTGQSKSDFVPSDIWTAWPMPADEVPRSAYLPNVGGKQAWRMEEDGRPSASLEEALLASTTRIARERWRSRRWEWAGNKLEGHAKKEGGEDLMMEQEEGSEMEESSPDRPMFSSQAPDALGQDSSSEEDQTAGSDDEAEVERRPVLLADDDRARQLLMPSIRHILTKADDLLEGLQKAREAYAGNWNKRKPEGCITGDETDTGAETGTSRARSTSRQPRKRARATSIHLEASVMSATSESSRGRRKPKMKHLKLRDWSDVLGMAALTGWDPNVVQRAAERCSRLFDENMLFRTFHEGEGTEKSYFTEQLASGQEPRLSDEGGVEEEDIRTRSKRDGARSSNSPVLDKVIRCPVKECPKHNKSYNRSKNMYDHVRQSHPEVDMKALKKLEAKRRGDRRGKWDRSS